MAVIDACFTSAGTSRRDIQRPIIIDRRAHTLPAIIGRRAHALPACIRCTAITLAIFSLSLAGACTPAPEPVAEPPQTPAPRTLPFDQNAMCEAWCKRHVACGLGRCVECPARSTRAEAMRTDYRVRLTLCLQGASCESMVGTKAFVECHDFAVRSIVITPKLRRYCFDAARRAAKCGRTDDADQSSCLIEQRHATDEALDAASTCLTKPCHEVPACMAAAIP